MGRSITLGMLLGHKNNKRYCHFLQHKSVLHAAMCLNSCISVTIPSEAGKMVWPGLQWLWRAPLQWPGLTQLTVRVEHTSARVTLHYKVWTQNGYAKQQNTERYISSFAFSLESRRLYQTSYKPLHRILSASASDKVMKCTASFMTDKPLRGI